MEQRLFVISDSRELFRLNGFGVVLKLFNNIAINELYVYAASTIFQAAWKFYKIFACKFPEFFELWETGSYSHAACKTSLNLLNGILKNLWISPKQ